jgi:hypothetical protein
MKDEMAYIGRCPCGCGAIPFATVDNPEWAKDTAKSIAQAIRDGYAIERVFLSEVRMSTCKRQPDLLTSSAV